MNRALLLVVLALLFGCSSEVKPNTESKASVPETPADLVLDEGKYLFPGEMDFQGFSWQRQSQVKTDSEGYLFLYASPYRNDVVLYHLFPPGSKIRRHISQAVPNDETKFWTPEGVSETITDGGFQVVTAFKAGKRNGANSVASEAGVKLLEVTYVDDVLDGRAKGAYPDGSPKWEAVLKMGDVIESKGWDQGGNVTEGFDVRELLP